MPAVGEYRLRLAKQDFKFSAAHFTLFADREAEALHGHNYRVEVEVSGGELDATGLLVEIAPLKARVRALCAAWDERVLLPSAAREVSIRQEGAEIEVAYRSRRYRFPAAEVVELPLVNTTIELLARLLWTELAPALAGSGLSLAVAVEETQGQSCRHEAPVD
jgi:6-pyruvoyltetrahydropterin/6-carboxytetrahydropterin synthase